MHSPPFLYCLGKYLPAFLYLEATRVETKRNTEEGIFRTTQRYRRTGFAGLKASTKSFIVPSVYEVPLPGTPSRHSQRACKFCCFFDYQTRFRYYRQRRRPSIRICGSELRRTNCIGVHARHSTSGRSCERHGDSKHIAPLNIHFR